MTGECSFLSPPTSISVRSAYVQKNICKVDMKDDNKNDDENIRHKREEKEEGEEKEGGEGEGEGKQQTIKEKNQYISDPPGADLILVGRVDGTVDLYQVQIP